MPVSVPVPGFWLPVISSVWLTNTTHSATALESRTAYTSPSYWKPAAVLASAR